jgi:hypothetical protein
MEFGGLLRNSDAPGSRPSAEIRGRIESLLGSMRAQPSPETLRAIRALQVLEAIGTPGAIEAHVANGDAEAQLTRDAQASLERALATAK